MKFHLITFAAAFIATKSLAVTIDTEIEDAELSNEVMFPQVAAYMNSLSESDLDQVEMYMGQVFASDSDDNEGILAQTMTEGDNDLAILANYLAQLDGEELSDIADHSADLNTAAFSQTMADHDMGEMWENMQKWAPNFAQALANELIEEDEDFI